MAQRIGTVIDCKVENGEQVCREVTWWGGEVFIGVIVLMLTLLLCSIAREKRQKREAWERKVEKWRQEARTRQVSPIKRG